MLNRRLAHLRSFHLLSATLGAAPSCNKRMGAETVGFAGGFPAARGEDLPDGTFLILNDQKAPSGVTSCVRSWEKAPAWLPLGVVIGIGASLAIARLMSTLLSGISATDPLTFVGVAVLLSVAALFASYIPARRA
jgi:hypothetical protein